VRPRPGPTRIADLLELADRAVQLGMARISAATDISHEQWRLLMILGRGTTPEREVDDAGVLERSMGELAERTGLRPPTLTRAVDRLVGAGLARRRTDPWDRRRVMVSVSADGRALVARAAAELDELFGPVLAEAEPAQGAEGAGQPDLMGVLARLERVARRERLERARCADGPAPDAGQEPG
jgi:DNA-binding MarR family transcriptional regulator